MLYLYLCCQLLHSVNEVKHSVHQNFSVHQKWLHFILKRGPPNVLDSGVLNDVLGTRLLQ